MAYGTATLTGTYRTFDDQPAEGVVEIIPNSRSLVDAEGDVILAGRVKATLTDGAFTVTLPATDDATVEPATGRQYTVVAKLRHTHLPAVTGVELATGATVDVADVASVPETDALVTPAASLAQLEALETEFTTFAARTDNPHAVTKAQVGLGSVDNTSDAAKPVSTAQASALAAKLDAADLDADTAALVEEPTSATAQALAATYAAKPDNGAQAVGQGELLINAKDYGATGDGTTDDSAALVSALAAAAGATLFLPKGTYNTAATSLSPASGTRILGAGTGTIIKSATAANIINANFVGNIRIESLTIDLGGSANQAIRLAGSTGSSVRDVRIINGGTGTGVGVISTSAQTIIEGLRVTGCKYAVLINNGSTDTKITNGVFTTGTDTATFTGHLYIPNGVRVTVVNTTVTSSANHGAWIGGATTSDVTLIGCTFRANGTTGGATDYRGVTVDSSCTRVKFVGCDFESNHEAGAYVSGTPTDVLFFACQARGNNTGFRPGGAGIEHLGTGKVSGCRSFGQLGDAANEGCGFYIGANGVTIEDCDAWTNYSAGIRSVNSKNTLILGNRCKNNSQRGVGLHDGIEVTGLTAGAAENITVSGNRCWDDQGTKTQRNGINVSSANVDYYIVTGNNTRGNQSTGLNDAGGVNKVVANNL